MNSSFILTDISMAIVRLCVIFFLVFPPVGAGINKRNLCSPTTYQIIRPEEHIESVFTSIQTAAIVGVEHCSQSQHYFPETSSRLNTDKSSLLMCNFTTNFDHQKIVILEKNQVVVESASFLFEKRPFESTLLYYHNGIINVIKGSGPILTKNSHLVLVGHGSKGCDGVSRLGGYGPKEIAKVVSTIVEAHIHTLSLVGCNLGRDLHFAKVLLHELRNLNVETKLHFWRSAVSVSFTGEKLTMDEGIWRHGDSSKEVIAWLDERGSFFTTVEHEKRGTIIPNYKGHPLYLHTLEWPSHPQMFVPADLRKKYMTIDCLEGLTWSLFFEEREKRRAPDFLLASGVLPVWLDKRQPREEVPIKHITTILDLVLEIRYHARENVNHDMYYVLNNFIFKVQKQTFFTSLVGKYVKSNSQQEIKMFLETFGAQKDHYNIAELRQDLKPSEFNDFCRQTFQKKHCEHNCGHWGRYFMEAVFSASIRNFRTFSLFLMSVIACEVSRSKGPDYSICSSFVGDDYPMLREDPWPFHGRRGFYGCTLSANEKIIKRERIYWLDEVIAKENSLYSRSKQMMSTVDHDQETELDIFGKVKVMNKDAFASYLEFFRGTVEGKKLARGCIVPPIYDPYE